MFPADSEPSTKLTIQNEISLKEDEIITQIEEIDDGKFFPYFSEQELISGWWSGVNTAGQSGLFPSNYCEMLPDGEISEADQAPPPQAEAEDLEAVPPVAPPPPPPPPPMPGSAPAAAGGEHMVAQYE